KATAARRGAVDRPGNALAELCRARPPFVTGDFRISRAEVRRHYVGLDQGEALDDIGEQLEAVTIFAQFLLDHRKRAAVRDAQRCEQDLKRNIRLLRAR